MGPGGSRWYRRAGEPQPEDDENDVEVDGMADGVGGLPLIGRWMDGVYYGAALLHTRTTALAGLEMGPPLPLDDACGLFGPV